MKYVIDDSRGDDDKKIKHLCRSAAQLTAVSFLSLVAGG